MSLVDADTGEVVETLTADQARALTDRIKVAVEATWHLIIEAYQGRAWATLSYSSWDDYCTREFGTSRLRLPREERQEVVASLRDAGLSVRAIASATSNSTRTVQKDLRQVSQSTTPDPEFIEMAERLDDRLSRPAEPRFKASVKPMKPPAPKVQGLDGKTYTAPKPAEKPRRAPLPDIAQKAGWEFRKAVERLERVAEDDRFSANREQVASHLRGHLSYAIEVCQDLVQQLDEES